MKTVIVTGANGFVGTHLCRELASQGTHVIAVIKEGTYEQDIRKIGNLEVVYCDLGQMASLDTLIQVSAPIDAFYHLAWQGTAGDMRGDYKAQLNNAEWACDAMCVAHKMNIPRFVFASSIMEYEVFKLMESDIKPPLGTVYSSAKVVANYMLKALAGKLGITYLRALISNIYGVGEMSPRLVNTSIRKLLKGEHCAFSAGEQLYDFIYVSDASRALRMIGELGVDNRTYYIGTEPKPLKEYLAELRDIVAPGIEIGLGELAFNGVTLDYTEFDVKALENDTGFKPKVSFAAGISMTAEWIKENINGRI